MRADDIGRQRAFRVAALVTMLFAMLPGTAVAAYSATHARGGWSDAGDDGQSERGSSAGRVAAHDDDGQFPRDRTPDGPGPRYPTTGTWLSDGEGSGVGRSGQGRAAFDAPDRGLPPGPSPGTSGDASGGSGPPEPGAQERAEAARGGHDGDASPVAGGDADTSEGAVEASVEGTDAAHTTGPRAGGAGSSWRTEYRSTDVATSADADAGPSLDGGAVSAEQSPAPTPDAGPPPRNEVPSQSAPPTAGGPVPEVSNAAVSAPVVPSAEVSPQRKLPWRAGPSRLSGEHTAPNGGGAPLSSLLSRGRSHKPAGERSYGDHSDSCRLLPLAILATSITRAPVRHRGFSARHLRAENRHRKPAVPVMSPVRETNSATAGTASLEPGGSGSGSPMTGPLVLWLVATSGIWVVLRPRPAPRHSIFWARPLERPG